VPVAQSQLLYDRLRACGVEATLHIEKGGGHGFWSDAIYQQMLAFYAKNLKPTPPAAPATTTKP